MNTKELKISVVDGRRPGLTIIHDLLYYSNMKGCYEGSRNGYGIQVDGELENKIERITNICHEIADAVYRLQEELDNNESRTR